MFQNFKTRLSQQLPETRAVAAPASPNQNPSPNAARRSEGRDADKEKEKDVSQGEYEVLQKQLARYKQRLGDVVQAYKTLQKEKQALEQSLQALSNAETGTTSTSAADGTTAAAAAVATAAAGEETQALQRRIAQLGEAVATLTKEKAALESAYLDEKRRLQQQHKDAVQERDRYAAELKDVTERLVTAQAEAEAPRAEEGTEALRRALDDERSRVQRLDRDLAAIEAAWAQRLANRDAEVARLQAELEDMTELHGELESRRESAEQRASRDEQELQGLRMEIEGLRRAKAEAESQLVALGSPVTSRRTSAQTHAATHAATPERKTSASAATTAPAPAPAASPLAATEPHAPAADTGAPDAAVTADAAAAADGADIDEEAVERRAEELALERVRVHEARVAASEAKCAQLQSMCDTLRHDMRAMKHEHQAQLSQLQDQLVANRERSVVILEDKEKELKELRDLLADGAAKRALTPPPDAQRNIPATSESREPLLHQMQMQMARDRELAVAMTARAQLKEQLDNAELQLEMQQRQIKQLTSEAEALKRAEKRENLSMEYLKNVMIKYFDAPAGQEQHLVRAVCALLQFTPDETDRVLRTQRSKGR